MTYSVSRPSALLSPFVKHFWCLESCAENGQVHDQRIVPNGLHELIFYFGDRPVSGDEQKPIDDNAVLSGQLRRFYDIQVGGRLNLFAIVFKPHGLSAFMDVPMNELYDRTVPLGCVVKNEVGGLEVRLFEAASFAERIQIAEHFLMQLLVKNDLNSNYQRIAACVNLINQHNGLADVGMLASEACLSRKQFERVFSRTVGGTPKQFLKTVRFQRAVAEKAFDKTISLTELTYRSGYFDQSHMTNDFVRFTGLTPKQYFSQCEPYSDYFQ